MAIYQEDDWIAEVEIIEDNSDKELESYKLRVIKTLEKSKVFKTPENGSEFNCSQNRKEYIRVFDLEK